MSKTIENLVRERNEAREKAEHYRNIFYQGWMYPVPKLPWEDSQSTSPQISAGDKRTDRANPRHPDYPKNVKRFIEKWQPTEHARQKAFWKEFRKSANAYSNFKYNAPVQGAAQSTENEDDN